MRLALDTNRYTDLCRGDVSVVETVELAAGTWRKDPAFDKALAAQDTIDEEMWQ